MASRASTTVLRGLYDTLRHRAARAARMTARRATSRTGKVVAAGLAGLTVISVSELRELRPQPWLQDEVQLPGGLLGEVPRDDVLLPERPVDALHQIDRLSDWELGREALHALEAIAGPGAEQDAELQWRLGRACFLAAEQERRGQLHDGDLVRPDPARRPALLAQARAALEQALRLDPNCGRAHQWMSAVVDALGEQGGVLGRAKSAEPALMHMKAAAELIPEDPLLRTWIGIWYLFVSELNCVTRTLARTAGVPIPEDSAQVALRWFEEAENVQPGKSAQNLLMMGKTLLHLQQHERALEVIRAAASIQTHRTAAQREAQKEAQQLLQAWPANSA